MALVGMVLERLLLRPMIGEPHFAVLMLIIGLGFILRAVAGAIWGGSPRALDSPYAGKVWQLGELVVGAESVFILAGTALLCLGLYLFFRFSRLGIAMQAASQNQLAAYYVGIPVKRIYALVWALSAVIATFAGVVTAPVSLVDPLMGLIGIKAFAAAIVGGFGSMPGAIIGGLVVALPVMRMTGIYLAVATLASPRAFYWLCLSVLAAALLIAANLLRSPSGRALVAVRDSEVSAASMGIHLIRTKTLAFGLSAGFTGLGSLHGVVFGAVFIGLLPQGLAVLRDTVPPAVAQIPGLEPGAFGAILVLVLIYEPLGMYGRWCKIRAYFSQFPLYRRATHKRQKRYLRTERLQ